MNMVYVTLVNFGHKIYFKKWLVLLRFDRGCLCDSRDPLLKPRPPGLFAICVLWKYAAPPHLFNWSENDTEAIVLCAGSPGSPQPVAISCVIPLSLSPCFLSLSQLFYPLKKAQKPQTILLIN